MTDRFHVLDGMRGLAAILIMQRHGPEFFGPEIGSTYLAVDMFFCLSGFVVANAYDQRLRSGELSFAGFMGRRLLRLWPLYLVAVAAMAVGAIAVGREVSPVSAALTAFYLPTLGSETLFPLLFVAWSLFWEIVACAAYGLTARWLTTRAIASLLGLSCVGLVTTIFYFGSLNVGFYWTGFWGGGARASFAFLAGVLVFRLRPRLRNGGAWPIMIALGAILLMPINGDLRMAYDMPAP